MVNSFTTYAECPGRKVMDAWQAMKNLAKYVGDLSDRAMEVTKVSNQGTHTLCEVSTMPGTLEITLWRLTTLQTMLLTNTAHTWRIFRQQISPLVAAVGLQFTSRRVAFTSCKEALLHWHLHRSSRHRPIKSSKTSEIELEHVPNLLRSVNNRFVDVLNFHICSISRNQQYESIWQGEFAKILKHVQLQIYQNMFGQVSQTYVPNVSSTCRKTCNIALSKSSCARC